MIMEIFDTHAHYADISFDEDREQVLTELPEKGVKLVMLAASSLDDSHENVLIARKYDYIYASVGVHPESIDETSSDYIETLRKLISSEPKIKAVGEIGLDYHYEGYDREKQIGFFRNQLELAKELNMPVIVHSRNATEDTLEILKEFRPKGVVHCFSGSSETAKEIIKIGMYIGFTGVLTFKNAKKALKALEAVPADRLLMETDCPYMAPEPFRGRRCDSSMIVYTATKAAEIKGLNVEELLEITKRNGMKMFNII
ncbi:TatD family hydrolase [Ruminococcus sp.]|uniref:TatD family hydrolase n=1 Tax=Ruminococcus sp. TaxID=41978 RepID=UPI0025E75E06|nr:TatD family hydrolase [Ruminococcus sp.]